MTVREFLQFGSDDDVAIYIGLLIFVASMEDYASASRPTLLKSVESVRNVLDHQVNVEAFRKRSLMGHEAFALKIIEDYGIRNKR